ncbi:serine/threonine protein kinase [Microbispora cellulosiformans]|uniref:non-specific serine/threonine protein kinase n=1 Tax=Microbispora cellulosiformans TaxID=2614688 RepID=A0A5J5JX10_9ACTN|nr:serine/threonine-protein kinase [Microbispora cellulosiformans]KAA9374951.1 serine/threonine protein kinase [Microbispora cellulosiformans]
MPEQHGRMLAERYELRVRIGRGTMGTVWRAYDRSLDREIAVKEIRQDPALSPRQRQELRERMLREGRMAARVSHPSVATIHDVILADGIPWIIMELVEGRSLEQVIDEEGPLPPRLVAEIGCDLLSALRAAHAQHILHRDVKPANVLLTETGRVVLTDFGIAKALGDTALTQTGMVIGSPGYTAPERARGDHTGPESDLWSLGATLYFAVEGRPAYERATVGETLAALMTESADPPAQAGPLRPVLEGLLEKDHRARLTPERAAAMLRMIADTPTGASPAPAQAPSARPAPAASSLADVPSDVTPADVSPGSASPPGATPGNTAPGGVAPDRVAPGSASPGGEAPGGVLGGYEEDANRTMVVARPTGVPRVPPPPPRPEPGSDPAGRHETTVPGRLPGTTGRGPAAAPAPASDRTAEGNATGRDAAGDTGYGHSSTGHGGAGDRGAGQRGAGSVSLPAGQPPMHPGPHTGQSPAHPGPHAGASASPAAGPHPGPHAGPHSGPHFGPHPSAHPDGPGVPEPGSPSWPGGLGGNSGGPGGPLEGPGGPGGPGDGVPGSSSLGTDLFAMRGPSSPDPGTRVRVLVTMGVVLAGLVVLILLAVVFFAK